MYLEKSSESKLSTSHSKTCRSEMFCLAHSITTSTWGSIARPVDTTGGTWTVTLSGTQSTTVLPQEIHAKDWDTVTHYKLIPVGIPQYSCTVIVFNLTGNDCSAILVCYCLGTDKEPVQLDHLIKKTRTFTSPVSLTQKKNPSEESHKVHRWLLHVFVLNSQSIQT